MTVTVLDHGFVTLVSKTGHVGASVVDAARCSFGSKGDALGDRDRALIAYLLGNGHTSPFRHAFFTFHIKAPLFVFRQWWKYQVGSTWREYESADGDPLRTSKGPTQPPAKSRPCGRSLAEGQWWNFCGETDMGQTVPVMCTECGGDMKLRDIPTHGYVVAHDIQIDTDQGSSWNELSGRYKVMEPEFYMPKEARRNTGKQSSAAVDDLELTDFMHDEMDEVTQTAIRCYQRMLEKGIAKELARLVLPPTIYSECYWTVSLQAILHFLDQRLKPEAQFEIQEYAKGILDLIRPTLDEMGLKR